MIMQNSTVNSCAARVEHRRSKRFRVSVAAELKWHGPGGARITEKAHAEEVNAHGGLLRMITYPNMGDIIELTNVVSAESVEGRVLAMRGSTADMPQGIVVELFVPSETFWGMNFQLMKTTAGLLKLGQSLRPEGIDLSILKEFRRETDSIRRSAWAVEESRRLHSQRHGLPEAVPLLRSEQIRCATRLCNELIIELEGEEVTFKTEGIAEFYRAVERAHQCLERLVMPEETGIREKRRSPRVQLPKGVWVAWQGGGQRFVSRVLDLSKGGVFIPTENLPPVGTVVRLTFELPDGEVYAPAVVRHTVVGRGMGVEFATAEDGDLVRILQLLTELVH
jgi:PilZ domain